MSAESPPPSPAPPQYPSADVADVALRDGSSIHFRPVRVDDGERIREFLEGVSEDSLLYRFFGATSIDWATRWAVDVDYSDRYAIVAEQGIDREIVAHAAYVRTDARSAEVAFLVTDELQGHGISTLMLAHLAAVARRHGIERFTAEVMGGNNRMLEMFRTSGFPTHLQAAAGEVHVEFSTELGPEALAEFERREQSAAVSALRRFLTPRAVAVIGASERAGSVGGEVMRKLIDAGFTGTIYPVNPKHGTVRDLRAYASIGDVPEPVDLAVVAIPAAQVPAVAAECAAAATHALLVLSAGFGELGEQGRVLQQQLHDVCRGSGMRLIGPNCLGLINTDPAVHLDATFTVASPAAGCIGVLSQSGGIGVALIEEANRVGLGMSSFVSVGNKIDISGNDLLAFWDQDPATKVILLYLESFGNPRRFARVARQVGRHKPVLAVKSGRTQAGARATASHTGALLAASDITVDALFRQAGVIRADTIGELLDTAALLSTQPVPRGGRIVIVTNGGGPGIIAADACQAAGLEVVVLPDKLQSALRRMLPAGAAVANPVDLVATAPADAYRRTLELLLAADVCDAILTLFVPALSTIASADVAAAVAVAGARASEVALASVYLDQQAPADVAPGGRVVPRFQFPEDAIRAIGNAVRYGAWRERPAGTVPEFDDLRTNAAATLIAAALARGAGWLEPAEVVELLRCYGLPMIETRVVRGPQAAARAGAEIGGPVVLKGIATEMVHKSDSGAVRLGLNGATEIVSAARAIRRAVERAGHKPEGLIVQRMAPEGVELLLGVVNDASFGPVLACGAGGITAELLGDVNVRITPVTDVDADEMLASLRVSRLLRGYRGRPPCDLAAVREALLRVSAMVEAHPEIAELDANPLIATPEGAVIVDARVRVEPAQPPRPPGALRD